MQPGKELLIDLGRQLIPGAPKDELIPRMIVFEDGTWSGDGDYLEPILKRRRAARDSLKDPIQLGESFDRANIGLEAAVQRAQEFVDNEKSRAASRDEQTAIVAAVGGFPDNLKINHRQNKPLFWFRQVYDEEKRRLDESRPSL